MPRRSARRATTSRGITAAEARLVRDRSLADPVWWMREVLGCEPWPVQAEIAEAVRDNRRVAVPSCHSAGKSFISARIALWWLFCNPGSIVLTTAPTFRQVRDVLWREIRQAYAKAKVPLGGTLPPSEPRLFIRDGWMMVGFSTDDPDRFQGWHAPKLLVVADEAPGIPQQIWEGVEGVLASGDARLLAIGNPVEPSGHFWEMCRPGSGVRRIPISAYDTPNFTQFGITESDVASGEWRRKVGKLPYPMLVAPDWVGERYRAWGPTSPMYLSRCLGEFPQSATDALIPLSWVEQAQRRELEPVGKVLLAADIARFGDDMTVACTRQGPVFRIVDAWGQLDTMATTGRLVSIARKVNASTVGVDSVGVGGGVADRLNELAGDDTEPFAAQAVELNAGEAPHDTEHYANARAEWYWGLRERFESGDIDIDPDDEELAAQLTSLKFTYRSNGKLLIESKQDMKARGLDSPDRADALMLAHALPDRTGAIFLPGAKRGPIGHQYSKQWNETFPPIPGTQKRKRRFY